MQCHLCKHVVPFSGQYEPVCCSLNASEKDMKLMLLSAEIDQCRHFDLDSKAFLNRESVPEYRLLLGDP